MKKVITAIIACIFVISLGFPGVSAKETQIFEDVPTTHANFKDINYLMEQGILEKGGKYRPADLITREEAIVMIAKAVGLNGTPRKTKFDDVPNNSINSGFIQSAVDAGIIYGVDEFTFGSTNKLNRLQMSLMLVRSFELPYEDKLEDGIRLFKDVSSSTFGANIIQSVVNAGITTGYADGTFKPLNGVTRAHMAAFLTRAMQYAEKNI